MKALKRWLTSEPWYNRRRPAQSKYLLRCSACHKYCYRWPWRTVWQNILSTCVWVIGFGLVSIGIHGTVRLIWAFILYTPWRMAEIRIYHWWWMHRHPTRCQGGGHAEPEPSAA